MVIPKFFELNNYNHHQVEVVYKALLLYMNEQAKSAYYYKGKKAIQTTSYYDMNDAKRIMNEIKDKYYQELKENNEDTINDYSYETAVKNMEHDRMEFRKRMKKGVSKENAK